MELTRTLDAPDEGSAEASVHAQYLFIALDCSNPLTPPSRLLLDTEEVHIGRGGRRSSKRQAAGGRSVLRIDIPDPWMSSVHARLVRDASPGSWRFEDPGSKNGSCINGTRSERATLRDGDVLEVGTTLFVFRALRHAGASGDLFPADNLWAGLPRTLHPPWAMTLAGATRVAESAVPMLLLGETGTGKEVLARALHDASGRSGPFLALNCGAVARTLIESELFGVRKGAFSGATVDRPGLIRAAHGGTLFLDEIAELPEASQVALLRVLQEGEVLPVGATRAVSVDLRVIAATNADLSARVAQGLFRADLYARLHGYSVVLPPLRDRREDLGLLITELLPRLAGERASRVRFSRSAGRALLAHRWPFNVRELEQALRTALAITTGDDIELAHLPEPLRTPSPTAGADPSPRVPDSAAPLESEKSRVERERIVAALDRCAGNQTQAARLLGISRATLVTKLAIHRLPRPRQRGR